MTLDKFLRAHPDVLVVVAAGNSGKAPKGTLTFNTVGTPATAKNVLTVGACQSDRTGTGSTRRGASASPAPSRCPRPPTSRSPATPTAPANLSSRGPTDYESVKPDLVAPGTFILSARAADDRSQPAVDGVPGLRQPLRLHRRDEHGRPDRGRRRRPRAPVPAGRPGDAGTVVGAGEGHPAGRGQAPPVHAGAGIAGGRRLPRLRPGLRPPRPGHDPPHRRRPEAAARLRRRGQRLARRPGEPHAGTPTRPGRARPPITVKVAEGAKSPLRVVLTWTDFAAVHVQNNLELVVTGPDLPIAVGNGENSFGKSSLFHPSEQEEFAGVTPDPANNVEQVTVRQAEGGRVPDPCDRREHPVPAPGLRRVRHRRPRVRRARPCVTTDRTE